MDSNEDVIEIDSNEPGICASSLINTICDLLNRELTIECDEVKQVNKFLLKAQIFF